MRKTLLTTLLLAGAMNAVAQQEAIAIDLSKKGADVSPDLYGIFFEEINHAGDGGLYAELVQNRGFEEHVLPSTMKYVKGQAVAIDSKNYEHGNNRKWSIPWNLEEKKYLGWQVAAIGCNVKRAVLPVKSPLHPNTPNAMQLKISGMKQGGKAVLTNTGYWGMGFKKGEKYDLRFYVKSTDYKGRITACINEGAKTLGTLEFAPKVVKEWTEYTGVLTSTGTTGDGSLSLEFDANGTILVDYVSLFPQNTFKGRKNGQRADLAQMLVGLHPKFMRWPGGCIVEGATYENRVKWKETLGDPMTRRGEWDLWGYRATWGMGYHEFLQFCEDLGMDAMFVDNAGMSCSVRNGDFVDSNEGLDAVIQDFRDAIDYALADPATNKWAKMRADAGHPKPFPLKYVEIGNENVGPEYVKHFNYIFKVLKAEYPKIIFINTLGHTDPLLAQIHGDYMVDPHWYRAPGFFFNNNHLFDNAPRTHDIYVGEYACNSGVGAGNLTAALSEAAFILGMERNSDVVKMTSYAPLFENVNHKDWPCNLIHFNSANVYGRASYYVQQMAAENRPTYNVTVSETTTQGEQLPFAAGTIGLGGFGAPCEYKDIKVTTPDGKTTAISPEQFKAKGGKWSTANGSLTLKEAERGGTITLLPAFKSDNYTLEMKVKKGEGRGSITVYYGMDENGENGYAANLGLWNNRMVVLQPVRKGRPGDFIGEAGRQEIVNDKWYDLKMEITPERTKLFLDGQEIINREPPVETIQFCQAGVDEQSGELVIKVVNGSDKAYSRDFEIAGAMNVNPHGKIITLAGDPEAENSFEQPVKLAPQTAVYGGFDKQFSYEFAPHSFTIMRVKVEKK